MKHVLIAYKFYAVQCWAPHKAQLAHMGQCQVPACACFGHGVQLVRCMSLFHLQLDSCRAQNGHSSEGEGAIQHWF